MPIAQNKVSYSNLLRTFDGGYSTPKRKASKDPFGFYDALCKKLKKFDYEICLSSEKHTYGISAGDDPAVEVDGYVAIFAIITENCAVKVFHYNVTIWHVLIVSND